MTHECAGPGTGAIGFRIMRESGGEILWPIEGVHDTEAEAKAHRVAIRGDWQGELRIVQVCWRGEGIGWGYCGGRDAVVTSVPPAKRRGGIS